MPQRRRAGFGYGAGAGLKTFGLGMLQSGRARALQKERERISVLDDLESEVRAGDLDPDQAEVNAQGRGIKIPKGYFAAIAPSRPKRLAGALASIEGAEKPSMVPTDESLRFEMGRMGEKIEPQTYLPGREPEGYGLLSRARTAKLRQFPPEKTGTDIAGTGEEARAEDVFSRYDVDTGRYEETQRIPSGPTAGAAGRAAGTQAGISELTKIQTPGLTQAEIQRDIQKEEGTRASRVATAGAMAGAGERARQRVHFEFQGERLKELYLAEMEKAAAKGEIEKVERIREATNASMKLRQFYTEAVALTQRINTQRAGPMARATGILKRTTELAGLQPAITDLDNLIAQNLRPLAVGIAGIREAQVSDKDMAIVEKGIGLSALKSRGEIYKVLVRLRAGISLGPLIAASVPTGYGATAEDPNGIGARFNLVLQWSQRQVAAEELARKAGDTYFHDPMTGAMWPVIPR